ncbi:MAG: hypothetical protein SGBAC_012661, partial [Bacillariaceae sp.]
DVPPNCGTGEGQSGAFCYSDIFSWLFYAIPTFVALICLTANSVVLFRFIWEHTRQNKTASKTASYRSKASKEITASTQNITSQMLSESEEEKRDSSSVTSSYSIKGDDEYDGDGNGEEDTLCGIDKYEDTEVEKQRRRMKLLGSQALLFVLSYVLCNVWTGFMLLKESGAQTQKEEHAMMVHYYDIAVLQSFFYPLQGFCNMMVYVRPKYLTYRYGMPDESRFSVARLAVFGDEADNNNNTNHNGAQRSPSRPSRKGSAPITTPSMVNANKDLSKSERINELSAEFTTGGDQQGPSSAIPLPRNMISSLTASLEDVESPARGAEENKDPRWGKPAEEVRDTKPRGRANGNARFQSSLRPSQLEVISELSESIFESVISAPDQVPSMVEPVSPGRSPESRWGTTQNRRPSNDLPPTLGFDISDRTMRISNRFEGSSNSTAPNADRPALAPSRMRSELEPASDHTSSHISDHSSVTSVVSENSDNRSVDIPIRPPTRRLSPTPSASS